MRLGRSTVVGTVAQVEAPREPSDATWSDMRVVMEAFARSHDPQFFAPDGTFTEVAVPRSATGREAIGEMLRHIYYEAFSDGRLDLRTVATDIERGVGLVEGTFRGRHTGELLGIPPTQRLVEVPMLAVYELATGADGGPEIRQGRLYYDIASLHRQLDQSA